MFSFRKRHKLLFDVIAAVVFAVGSFSSWYSYFGPERKKMDLFGAIVFGIMAIFKLVDVIEEIQAKRKKLQ